MDFLAWLVPIAASCIVTTVLGFIIKRILDKKFAEQKELTELREDRARREHREVIEEAIRAETAKIDEHLGFMEANMAKLDDRMQKVEVGTQAGLRTDLLTNYYKCSEKGFRSSEDMQNWEAMYIAYKALGGNSFIDDIRAEFNKLPSKSEYERLLKNNKGE